MQTKNNAKQLYLLLVIAILPVILGTFLYYFRDHFQFKTLNHGTFVNPPIEISKLGLAEDKKWRIIYFPIECCDKRCENIMHNLHQLRKLFNKDSSRISLVLAVNQGCKITDTHDFQKWDLANQPYSKFKNKISLVDPAGNLFMFYPSDVNPLDIFKDLKRVLEVSRIG